MKSSLCVSLSFSLYSRDPLVCENKAENTTRELSSTQTPAPVTEQWRHPIAPSLTLAILFRSSFQVNGVPKDKMICKENALSFPAPSKQEQKNLDTKRYARAEVSRCPFALLVLLAWFLVCLALSWSKDQGHDPLLYKSKRLLQGTPPWSAVRCAHGNC